MKIRIFSLLLIFILFTKCNATDQEEVNETTYPDVTISLSEQDVLQVDQEILVQSTSFHDRGITQVELLVNGEPTRIDSNPDPEPNTAYIVAQPWIPKTLGTYTLQVRAYNTANISGESETITVSVVETVVVMTTLTPTPLATTTPALAVFTLTPLPSPTTSEPTPVPLGPVRPDEAEKGVKSTAVALTAAEETAIPTLTPSATPTLPTFSPTGLEPEGRFAEIWTELGRGDSRLGYPTDNIIIDRDYAWQTFERGFMFWWDLPVEPDLIWVVDAPEVGFQSGHYWTQHADIWPGEPIYSCEAAENNGHLGPMRGFGFVWCESQDIRTRLGSPTQAELGSGGQIPFSQAQVFQGGIMIYNPHTQQVLILFNQGDWQLVWY